LNQNRNSSSVFPLANANVLAAENLPKTSGLAPKDLPSHGNGLAMRQFVDFPIDRNRTALKWCNCFHACPAG
jgi:hypothetical protein